MRIISIALIVLVVLVAIGSVHALNITPTSFTLIGGKISYINITFYNNQNISANITINTQSAEVSYGYYFSAIGVKPNSFVIQPGGSQVVLFSFSTNDVFFSSPVQIQIPYSINGRPESFTLNAPIIPPNQSLIYISSMSAPKTIYPSSVFGFNLSVINGLGEVGINIPFKYSLMLNSKVLYSGSENVVLTGLGLNNLHFSLPINTSTAPGNYTLQASLVYVGNMSSLSEGVSVLPYYSVSRSQHTSSNAFGMSQTVTITNAGNVNVPKSNLSVPVSSFNSLFLVSAKSSLGSASVSKGFLSSSIPYLLPGQSITLSYSVSYVPIYIIIALAIVAIVLFFYFNRKAVLKKEVVEHKSTEGFIDVKIALRLKNISKHPLTNIEIIEPVPLNALKVSNAGQKEGKISRVNGALRVSWKEQELNPKDEVILMYEIKSKIGIIGSMTLKPATVKFKSNGRAYQRKSNSLILNVTPPRR